MTFSADCPILWLLEVTLESIVSDTVQELSDKLLALEPQQLVAAYKICELLAETPPASSAPEALGEHNSDDKKASGVPADAEETLCKELVERNPYLSAMVILDAKAQLMRLRILRVVDGSRLQLHCQAQVKAIPKLKQGFFALALSRAEAEMKRYVVSTADQPISPVVFLMSLAVRKQHRSTV